MMSSPIILFFIFYRNPTPNNEPVAWQPVTSSTSVNFLDVSNEGLHLAQNPHFKSIEFLDKLFEKYKQIAINVENVKVSTSLGSSSPLSSSEPLVNDENVRVKSEL